MKNQTEKQRLLNNAYKQKVKNLKFNLFQLSYLPIHKGIVPLCIEYQKIQFTKYLRIQLMILNIGLIINLKLFNNETK